MASLVFDLDGTLIDSAPDILAAANRLLADCDRPPLDLPTLTSFIGNGVPKLVERVMQARSLDMSRHPELYRLMMQHYQEQNSALTRLFEGAREALEALALAGHSLGLCTNKPAAATAEVLRDFGLSGRFQVVIAGDSLATRKPDPQPLLAAFEALQHMGATGPRIYVGDSSFDAETAQRAGIDFALFTRGYRSQPVSALAHRWAFDDYARLLDLLGLG
jgi:phosphoglycolate phosphatase